MKPILVKVNYNVDNSSSHFLTITYIIELFANSPDSFNHHFMYDMKKKIEVQPKKNWTFKNDYFKNIYLKFQL